MMKYFDMFVMKDGEFTGETEPRVINTDYIIAAKPYMYDGIIIYTFNTDFIVKGRLEDLLK